MFTYCIIRVCNLLIINSKKKLPIGVIISYVITLNISLNKQLFLEKNTKIKTKSQIRTKMNLLNTKEPY